MLKIELPTVIDLQSHGGQFYDMMRHEGKTFGERCVEVVVTIPFRFAENFPGSSGRRATRARLSLRG